ncbi:integrase [Nonlabens tegetincola]|uniref:Integrase n=1 Tax=Nonlabens tegetincola TaxID=323273 RepID=A0A090Q042_9FLAO|nr:site-specific integrase [Nonlabens tegetincola]GAK95527.1 integrase [Nonlabens tegetincola]
MIQHTFNLKNPNGNKETLIFLRARFPEENKYFKYSTGESIHPKYWDKKNKRPNRIPGRSADAIKCREVDTQLARYSDEFYRSVSELKIHDMKVTIEAVREKLDLVFKKTVSKKTFFEVYQLFIDERKLLGKVGGRTIQKDENILKTLRDFQDYTKFSVRFNTMNKDFYIRFVRYCREEKEHRLKDNTLGKHFAYLKTFLRWARDNGYHTNNDFTKWENISSDTYEIALTEDELLKLYNYDFSNHKKLERVRDVFVFGCATGLRYSDYSKVSKANIQNDCLLVNTQKTKNYLTIPLNKYSKNILEKYNYELPSISPQRFRDYIKDAAELCEIDTPIKKVSFMGSKRIEKTHKKHKLIGTHTARRTFITLSLEKGMRPEVVMSITGHKDYKSFQKYIKLSQRVKADEMNKAWN